MRQPHKERAAPHGGNGSQGGDRDCGSSIKEVDNASGWRKQYKVHPAADVFPMMSDAELRTLGDDIKANGLDVPIKFYFDGEAKVIVDGRNRLEAMERVGVEPREWEIHCIGFAPLNPIPHIISLNIHRRHLTKQQQADLIVAAVKAAEKPGQAGPVSKGGRGNKSPVKEKALAVNAELPDEQRVSERTIKRAIAKTEGRKPQPKAAPVGFTEATNLIGSVNRFAEFCSDNKPAVVAGGVLPHEVQDLRGHIATIKAWLNTLVDALAGDDDYPELPEFLDRRKKR